MNRNTLVVAILAAVAFVMFAGPGGPAAAAESGPIRIGFLAPLTGTWAQSGQDMVIGAKLFLESTRYTAGGRKIELIVEDEGAAPATAITKARKLINHDKVHMVCGVWLSSSAYAVAPVCEEAKVPFITSGAGDDLTQRKRSKTLARVSFTGSQYGHVAGDYAYNHLKWRKVAMLGWEHAFGQEVMGSFQKVFEDAGGKVIQRIYCPLTTLDFGPYIGELNKSADGLFDMATGSPSMSFLRSLKASGLMDKWKVLTVGTAIDEAFLQQLKDTALGVLSVDMYSAALDTPENKVFREMVVKATKRDPTYNTVCSYTGFDWVTQAINAVGGDVENREKLMNAVRAIEIKQSPRGPLKLDPYGNVVQNYYVRRVDKAGGQYQNTVIHTYPMVSQFWKYDPEEFLKKPTYSRDYPTCCQ
ncbi:MAG TPA: ABC transporter substrate-binding protein [Thermodesulfobacteriota bacterium]|nr:ABC transporter substrate-binding protein [Thermodesulfobacteriota bacterium]